VIFSLVLEFYLKFKQKYKIELFLKKLRFKTIHENLLSALFSTRFLPTPLYFSEIIGFENIW